MLRPNRRFRLEEGITLVEVIIAMFILSVALLAMASTATSSLISLAGSRDREQATNAASAAIERARALDFTDLVVPATPAVSGLPTDIQALFSITGDCADAEQIVRDAAATGGVTLEEAVGHNELFTVYTIVTWADEPCGATAGDLKRVVAIAAWRDRGRLLTVRNETLVTRVGRGLPVPAFELLPAAATLSLTEDQAANGTERCTVHQLRNLGSADRYQWRVDSATDTTGGTVAVTRVGNAWHVGGDWAVRAFFQHPADPGADGAVPSTGLMQDVDLDGRPESDALVASRERATLSLCYQSLRGVSALPVYVEVEVLSRFDDRVTQQLTQQVEIASGVVQLHLQDRDDTQSHERRADTGTAEMRYPPYRMNPIDMASGDRQQMPSATLWNWGTELYPGVPGLPLLRATSGSQHERLRAADFRYGFPATKVLSSPASLRIWTSPVTAWSDGAINPQRVRLQVDVDVLNAAETAVVWSAPTSFFIEYDHTGAVYRATTLPLELGAGVTVQNNQKLRLRVTCMPESVHDCAIGYDVVGYGAYLEVVLE